VTWVKVCGITSIEARDAAIDGGADAIGFVIDPASPRYMAQEAIAELCHDVPIERFIVGVDVEPARLIDLARTVGATGIQNHGRYADEAAAAAIAAGLGALRPIPVRGDAITVDPRSIPRGSLPLFDTASPGLHGGSGRSFPWEAVAGVDVPFVLAGGLGVDNVAEAVATVHPWGVDASSRLEVVSGRKDPDTIRTFLREAKKG